MKKAQLWLVALIFVPVSLLVIISPLNTQNQYVFALINIAFLFLVSRSKQRKYSIIMILISVLMSTRYMYFRMTYTLHFGSQIEEIFGIALFIAECYSWLMLLICYFQILYPLDRKIVPMPEDMSLWPTVDVYIPTYNEDLQVVRDTVLAAQCLDYPEDKMNIYLLDDGNRTPFAAFAAKAGVGYITREDNHHAKAGNLNHAMALTDGEFICVFDCDHVATRMFLQSTLGGFLTDPKLALLQTPHHFYSPDPIARNLYGHHDIPTEGELFYGPVQQGNDTWNATFFCGSCAVIRRTALEETHGFAYETVTEDAHTALKMQRKGWKSAFLSIPLAAGLATERTALHVIQRNRWARGMTQIFRMDNPLLGRGLTFPQRLCYLSAMLYFQFSLPRLIFVFAPLAYLLFGLNVIYGSATMLLAYALPHFLIGIYVNARLDGKHRYSFWGDIYDLLLAFHLVIPTFVTMLFPKRGKFNVTDKGGLLDKNYFDLHIVLPHIIAALMLVAGAILGCIRLIDADLGSLGSSVAINVGWCLYNLIFLLGAIAVARETKQIRSSIRIDAEVAAIIHYASGIASVTKTRNLSMGGCMLEAPDDRHLTDTIEEVELQLKGGISLPVEVIHGDEQVIRLKFQSIPLAERRELVRVVLARADAWVGEGSPKKYQGPLRSFCTICVCIYQVYAGLITDYFQRRALRKQRKQAAKQAEKHPASVYKDSLS